MNGRPDGPSLALLAAQRRLEELKSSFQQSAVGWQRLAVSREPLEDSGLRSVASDQLKTGCYQPSAISHEPPATSRQPPTTVDHPLSTDHSVRLYPDIALGMLGKGLAGPGRIWLLLRHLDREGRGWLRIEQVREKLTDKRSALRVCGRRQLRNQLRQGQGIFWQRDKDRLWLRSAGRVAAALGIDRLRGQPVALPLTILLSSIGQVRAHFYASFHSGRQANEKEKTGAPIKRETLEKITHVPARTQRLYEGRAGVMSQANFAVGERLTAKNLQERAWGHGRATFLFTDSKGKQGPAGGRYVAWRLPNSYQGPHASSPKGRQKKINHQIDLVNSRAQGNDLDRGISWTKDDRLFHTSGREAGRAYNRDQTRDIYYPAARPPAGGRRVWRVLPAKGGC